MIDWLKEFNRVDLERARLYRLLKSIEWSGTIYGEGSGVMNSHKPDTGKGLPCRSCRICGGIDPNGPNSSGFLSEAKGHKANCWLGNITKGNL